MSSPVENTRAVITFIEACAARYHGQHEYATELIESLEGDDLLGGGIGSLILTAQSWAESNRQAFFLLKGVGMILKERAIRDIDLIPRTYFDALDGLGTALLGIFAADEQTVLEYPRQPRVEDERRVLTAALHVTVEAICSAHSSGGGELKPEQVYMVVGVNACDAYESVGGTDEMPNFDNPVAGAWSVRDL